MNKLGILSFCLLSFLNIIAQNKVDIKFNPTFSSKQKSCFDIELKAVESGEISLAGQNYRIFYN